jgi:hypothetical protein
MDRILPLASPPPPARLFFLPDAAHAWREEVDGTTARLGVQHLSNAYFRKSLEEVSSSDARQSAIGSKRRGTAVTRPSAPRSTTASVTTKPNSFRSTKTLSGPTSATPSAYCTSLAGRNSTRSYIPKRSTAATGDRQGPDQVLKMRT